VKAGPGWRRSGCRTRRASRRRGPPHPDAPLQRPPGSGAPALRARQHPRRCDPRAGRREHGGHRPRPGYLQGILEACRRHGTLMIVDEVMTGFRLAPGGACQLYGIRPDLVTFGKVIGGGLPVAPSAAARGHGPDRPGRPRLPGRDPLGEPAGDGGRVATLRQMGPPSTRSWRRSRRAWPRARRRRARGRVAVQVNRVGSMLTVFFTPSRSTTPRAPGGPTRGDSPGSSMRCWRTGSTCPRPSSRPRSCRSPRRRGDRPHARGRPEGLRRRGPGIAGLH